MKVTMDFETRSECDITTEGAWKYSQHSSTDVMCLAYAIDDRPAKMWIPPKHAVRYIFNVRAKHKGLMGHFSRVKGKAKKVTKKMQDEYATKTPFEWGKAYNILEAKRVNKGWNWEGDLVLPIWSRYRIKSKPDFLSLINTVTDLEFEAHNAFFEKSVWENVCVPKYNFPKLDDTSWSCSAALAATRALPRALDKVGETLALPIQKNHDGKLVMMQLSRPGQDGKFNSDPLKLSTLYSYCLDDVRAEREVSKRLGTLNSFERRVWLLDQKINKRGVPLDVEVIKGAIKIIETYTKVLEEEMSKLTDGRLTNTRQVAALQLWLEENKVLVDNVQKATVEAVLNRTDISPKVRRVLEVRQALGQTSTAKYYAMLNFLCSDGTAKDQFMYSGASTLRWSGRGIQFQNLPRGALKVSEEVYAAIKSGSYRQLRLHGDVMDLLSSSIRGVAAAPEGFDFLDSDFSNIEGRVLAWIAGEEWKIKAFEDFDNGIGHDLYILAYARSFGIDTKDVDDAKRQIGKVMELACFAPETQVLTYDGYKSIIDVSENDLLWDGVEWVKNSGVLYKGMKKVLKLDGVRVTADHKVMGQKGWISARMAASKEKMLYQCLEKGSQNLPSLALNISPQEGWTTLKSSVAAEMNPTKLALATYKEEEALGAIPAPRKRQVTGVKNTTGMQTLSQIKNTDEDYLTEYPHVLTDAKTPMIPDIITTGGEEYACIPSGCKIEKSILGILRRLQGGIIRISNWIELTLTGIMNPEILDLSQNEKTSITAEQYEKCKSESKNLSPVYDIMNSGPRNRFTIKSDSGHLIVHNCGYQGSIGAFQNMAKVYGVEVPDDKAKSLVDLWRSTNPLIVKLWSAMETAAKKAILTGREVEVNSFVSFVVKDDFLEMRTIAGSTLYYYQPRVEDQETMWGTVKPTIMFTGVNSVTRKTERQSTYGGKLTENVVQHLARMVLCEAMLDLDDNGFDIVMHVHDQVVSQVPCNDNELNVTKYDEIMQKRRDWCRGLPLAAKGEIIKRFKKG